MDVGCRRLVGTILGSILPSARVAQGIGVLLWFAMDILCEVGPPPGVSSDAMTWVARFMPPTHTIRLLQDPWMGFGWNVLETIIVVGISVGAALVNVRFFRWE